ncbi:AAA family ATPase (plasmid) [Pontibacillus sp. ALD_SL1]|uniref:AAA family ATPase n=1 Tax=Pontibacillus sp. ALD_SL1 TaxID=2777185 RepID=UPI001A97B569|nr:FtsH/Yme1/Tma family ATP-dependent metallopeptidase [Pontibacillus sp. ALD_SL1]QST02891.1 AAA family ATPase [Pontibacillus sp. ALD_SL1]
MNKGKRVLLYSFLAIILVGIFGSMTTPNPNGTETISLHAFLEKMTLSEGKEGREILHYEKGTAYLLGGETTYKTTLPPHSDVLAEKLEEFPLSYTYVRDVNFLETVFKFALPVFLIVLVILMIRAQKKGIGGPQDMVKKSIVQSSIPATTMKEVGGLGLETKGEILQMIEIMKRKEEAKALGIRATKGVLLYGPPGTGKTLLAKAMANSLGAQFYPMSGSSFVEMFVGVGAKRVRELFKEARKNAPALIFIDEIDSIASKRSEGGNRNDEREATLNELLAQLDGVDNNEDVYLIAATNRIDMLDPAILRPGRFDSKLLIGLPDLQGRTEIIHIHSRNKKLHGDVKKNLGVIAQSTTGFTGADIENLFNNAAKKALLSGKGTIDMEDIHHALDTAALGTANRKIHDEKIKKRVAYHEAGHALVQIITKPKSVRKTTIIPRGEALGFMAPIPKDMDLKTTAEMIDEIAVCLAGGLAEQMIYGEHSIGVGGDVETAKRYLDHMVKIGMKHNGFQLPFSRREEETLRRDLFQASINRATTILTEQKEALEKITEALMEKETINGDDIEACLTT